MSGSNDMALFYQNMATGVAAYPHGMISCYGDTAQVSINNNINPWLAYQTQQIHYGAHYNLPTVTAPIMPGLVDCKTYVEGCMLKMNTTPRVATTIQTVDKIITNLEALLKRNDVTDAQKATAREQMTELQALKRDLDALKQKCENGGKWAEASAELDALLGRKQEIDTKINELLKEIAEAGGDDGGDDGVDPTADEVFQTAMAAKATTKAAAEANLTTVYGDNKPASVKAGDDGKFTREITVGGQKVTKTYESLQDLEDQTKELKAENKAEAEENLKIFYADNIPEGVTATEDGKLQKADLTGTFDTIKDLQAAIEAQQRQVNGQGNGQGNGNLGNGQGNNNQDPAKTAAMSAVATNSVGAQKNLTAYYAQSIPTSVVTTDAGKLTRKVTVDGQQLTKTYDSIEDMIAEAKTMKPTTQAEAEQNLKIAFDGKLPEGVSVSPNGQLSLEGLSGTYASIAELEAAAEAYSETTAPSTAEELEALRTFNDDVERISTTFAEAVDYDWGTDDGKLKKAMSSLTKDNVIEVIDRYNTKDYIKDGEDFIEAFENDASSGQQYKLGNYLYNALLERAIDLGLVKGELIPKNTDGSFGRVSYEDKYAVASEVQPMDYWDKNGNVFRADLAADFQTLFKELNAWGSTDSGDVEHAVRNIVTMIKHYEAALARQAQ